MSQHDEHHHENGAGGERYEADMPGSVSGVVGAYIVVLTVAFFATVGAIYMYFRYQTDLEVQRKTVAAESTELQKLRAQEDAALQGKLKSAMQKVVQEAVAR